MRQTDPPGPDHAHTAVYTTARIGIPAPLVPGKSITRAVNEKFPQLPLRPLNGNFKFGTALKS